jgi:LemA protein
VTKPEKYLGVPNMNPLYIVLGVIALLFLMFMSIYNSLVALRNHFKNAFAQIDVQLKRRYDLIPNLVETAKAYMDHESETLQAVTEARNVALAAAKAAGGNPGDPGAMNALGSAEGLLSKALGGLTVTMEQYPDLKASQNVLDVQEELKSTENRIAFARQAYNDSVTEYNVSREKFPNVLVSGPFNFKEASLLEIDFGQDDAQKEAPRVSF